MKCKICGNNNEKIFTAVVLNKYNVSYYYCSNCGFLQTEEPYWFSEAYKSPINIYDTGYLQRNINLSKIVSFVLYFLFDKSGKFVDFGGGYGIFVRLMRDIGFDFYLYEPYTENLFARGFECKNDMEVEALTAFEVFEHLPNPKDELEKMLSISKNIIFTTELLPNPIPRPNEWWYYGLEHGQHVSFYSEETLQYIAKQYELYYVHSECLHLFTEKRDISKFKLRVISKLGKYLNFWVKNHMRSKTFEDMNFLKVNKSKL